MTAQHWDFIKENATMLTVPEMVKAIGLTYPCIRSAMKRHSIPIKLERLKDGYIPQAKQLRVMDIAEALCAKRYGITELADLVDSSERTVYRYLRFLKGMGIDVLIDSHGNFYIKNCPFCKRPVA